MRIEQCTQWLTRAVQPRFHDPRADPEHFSRLFGAYVFDVAQEKHRPMVFSKPVDRLSDQGPRFVRQSALSEGACQQEIVAPCA